MNKEKLIGMNNTEDSIWFKLEGTDKSVEFLDKIFHIADILYEPEDEDRTYKKIISFGDVSFLQDSSGDNVRVYFIFTPKIIHIILRKIRDFESKQKQILEHFEFKK